MIHKIRENAAFQDVKCHPLKGLALVGDIVLAAGGWWLVPSLRAQNCPECVQ